MIAAVWVIFNTRRWNNREVFQWDTDGYYLYLPAALIHHDLLELHFLDSIPPTSPRKDYHFGQGAFRVAATGHYADKYTMGTAVFELPFFLAAHAWCILFPADGTADGYSPPYHLAIALASAVWPWLGLLVLIRFLRRYLEDAHSAIALLAISIGTNLFFYSSLASGMSHPFLFFLCAWLIERTDAWYTKPSLRAAIIIGASIGWMVLTRPTCALFALVPIGWSLRSGGLRMLLAHRGHLIAAVLMALLCIIPQLFYWKAATDHFLFYSYGDEGFRFAHPHMLDGLFGFRKGWFVYSPIALVACMGVPLLLRDERSRSYPLMLGIFFVPFLFVVFSWTPWWYGGGFGSRVLIETLPLLMLPLAMLVRWTFTRGRPLAITLCTVLVLGICLNLFQQWQYLHGIIHYENMNRELYWKTFLAPSHEAAGIPLDQ